MKKLLDYLGYYFYAWGGWYSQFVLLHKLGPRIYYLSWITLDSHFYAGGWRPWGGGV